jgi:hypothetical protein
MYWVSSFATVWFCDNQGENGPVGNVAVQADIIINVRKYALNVLSINLVQV